MNAKRSKCCVRSDNKTTIVNGKIVHGFLSPTRVSVLGIIFTFEVTYVLYITHIGQNNLDR